MRYARARFTGLVAIGTLVTTSGALSIAAPAATATTADTAAARPVRATADCPAPGGQAVPDAVEPDGAVKIYGHGWGHGMGMSQYGAQGAARLGCDYRTILATYYRNTTLVDRATSAPVVLTLASRSLRASVVAETGAVHWVAGSQLTVQPKGTTWTVTPRVVGGVAGVAALDQAQQVAAFVPGVGLLRARTAGTVVRVNAGSGASSIRTGWGTTRFSISAPGTLAVAHVIGSGVYPASQKYLFGLGEVPVSWPTEALKAQVVAARTYLASKYDADRGAYVLTAGTADQVYRGYDHEAVDARLGNRWRSAVLATEGEVLVDDDARVISAMYSSSMGGHTENRQYVYGNYGISYLKAVDDSRWDNASDNPYRRWSAGFSRAEFAQRLGFSSVSAWKVAPRGSAKRVDGIVVTGVRAGRTVTVHFTGSQARSRLGLRSPGFVFGGVTADGGTGTD